MTTPLVTAAWLETHLKDDHIILLDASPTFDLSSTIQGAQHIDIKNTFSDTSSLFPNTFPTAAQFQREARALGINTNSHIVVFDPKGIFHSPRVWWMFRTMGHEKVSVLDGGLPAWNSNRYPTGNPTQITRKEGDFKASLDPTAIKSYEHILQNSKDSACTLIDARSSGRFEGTDPEPRAHIKSGHIPNALNLPYTEVLEDGSYKSKEELNTIFKSLQLPDKPIIFSCGSGITACVILLARYLGTGQLSLVYDGSWTEWAEKQELFVE